MWLFPKIGGLLCGRPSQKSLTSWGLYLGAPDVWKLPCSIELSFPETLSPGLAFISTEVQGFYRSVDINARRIPQYPNNQAPEIQCSNRASPKEPGHRAPRGSSRPLLASHEAPMALTTFGQAPLS